MKPINTVRSLKWFEEISKIPRESGNEQEISNYLYDFAKQRNLWVIQDDFFNIIIKKPGTQGYENSPPVVLQAHLDMICVKTPQSKHNFNKDPISFEIKGDFIYSSTGTSLGADCGIGMGLILQVLESETLTHPPIEALFTTREETDFGGAYGFDPKLITGKQMINLDVGTDDIILSGSCGGTALEMEIPIQKKGFLPSRTLVKIKISGLEGGHSGGDIHKGRGNAIILLGRVLAFLKKNHTIDLCEFQGGISRVAIPETAHAIISIEESKTPEIKKAIDDFYLSMKDEYQKVFPDFLIQGISCSKKFETILDDASFSKILTGIFLTPQGIGEMSNVFDHQVESSQNLGIIREDGDSYRLISEIRGSFESSIAFLVEKNKYLAPLIQGKVIEHSPYAPWKYSEKSPLREKIIEIAKDSYHQNLKICVLHAGNEMGILSEKISNLDGIAIGPLREFFHSPRERLSISSVIKFEKFLNKILEELR